MKTVDLFFAQMRIKLNQNPAARLQYAEGLADQLLRIFRREVIQNIRKDDRIKGL